MLFVMGEKQPLDIGCILLATVVKPTSIAYNSGPFSVADHLGHIYSVSVKDGVGSIVSGSPGPKIHTEYSKHVNSTTDECISDIAEELKQIIENVNDVKIVSYNLQWGINEGSAPVLLGCNGTEVTAPAILYGKSGDSYPYLIPFFTLFYAAESLMSIVKSQCYSKGKNCFGGTQTIERSKIISIKIKRFCENLDLADDDQYVSYLKKRMSSLLAKLMMANVPVCSTCFKYYSFKANVDKVNKTSRQKSCTPLIANRSQCQRPQTSQAVMRSSLPVIKPEKPYGEVGDITPSGLKYTQGYATAAVQFAHRVYRNPPFYRPPPPPPPQKNNNNSRKQPSA